MTAYNAENYIKDAIESILNQKFKNWNLILVDDKSTDNTLKVVKLFHSKKINIYSLKKHVGRTNALNYGLKKCNGEFVAILDADDLCNKNRLMEQVNFLQKNRKFKMVGSWAIKVDQFKKKIGEIKISNLPPSKNISLLLGQQFIPHSTLMFCLSHARKYGGYPSDLKYAQDFGLILQFIKKNKLYILPKFLTKIRVLSDSMSFRNEYQKIIIKDHIKLLGYVRKNFHLNFNDRIKNYFYILKNYIKFAKNLFK